MDSGAAFGEVLRTLRSRAGLTQEELSARSGLSARAIGGLERGRTGRPHDRTVELLAVALQLSPAGARDLMAAARRPSGPRRAAEPAEVPMGKPGPLMADGVVGLVQLGSAALCQLPPDLPDFTGRGSQVEELTGRLAVPPGDPAREAVQVCVIAGAGGMGKTTLAVHAAHRLRACFPDGQLYVNLRGTRQPPQAPHAVLGRLLRDLRVVGEHIPADPDERAGLYRSMLADKRTFILLDDARDAAQVRALLPPTGSCAVLVTSRGRLPGLDGAYHMDLDVLDDNESRELFTRIIDRKETAEEAAAAGDVLRQCAGLPLAIRIAASRLIAQPGWTLRTLADRFTGHGDILGELQVDDQAVRASFALSYALLAPESGRAFALVATWDGPTLATRAAAAMLARPEALAERALDALVGVNLLQAAGPGRYRYHDLLRRYATEQAQVRHNPAERSMAVERALAWYVHAAHAASSVIWPDPALQVQAIPAAGQVPAFASCGDALAWNEAERHNIVAAVAQAARHGLHPHAWRLAVVSRRFFSQRAYWDDWAGTHEIGLESARAAGDRRGAARILEGLAAARGKQGRLAECIDLATRSMRLFRETGDGIGEADCLNNLGVAHSIAGRYDEALGLMRRALTLTRAAGHPVREVRSLANLAKVMALLGSMEDALTCAEQAGAVAQQTGDLELHGGLVMSVLGDIHLHFQRPHDASRYFREAHTTHSRRGQPEEEAWNLAHLGEALLCTEAPDEARRSLEEALSIYERLGAPEAAGIRRRLQAPGHAGRGLAHR